ncbi:hypothetical protein CRYUN_Cryun14cG0038200 [Craigia yunnanensis]
MAKTSVLRSENPMAPDLSSAHSVFRGSSSSSPILRRDLICESLTSGPSHATDITREVIREGADVVIAVGGDGTLHEVVNGFFWDGKPVANRNTKAVHSTALGEFITILSLLAAHSLGDWVRFRPNIGLDSLCLSSLDSFVISFYDMIALSQVFVIASFLRKNDPREAIERIARGFADDAVWSAKAGYYASRYKKFGNLCYVIGSLRAFNGHRNQDLRIKVVILQDFKLYDLILKLHKLYNGTHLSVKNVTSRK